MSGTKKLSMKKALASGLAVFAMLTLSTTAHAKLATNKLATNRLSPYSAAANSAMASMLAASPIASARLGPNAYAANRETTAAFISTPEGREVLGYIVGCALPDGDKLLATGTDGTTFEFFGEAGLAKEWVNHRLFKAGRGWVSACLFARVNNHNTPVPVSMRGPHHALATSTDEEQGWALEEGAFYGDYFVAPGAPVQWIACRGRDQAASEFGGLVDRDCTEPDPNDPTHTVCGFTYAGECGAFAPEPVCNRFWWEGFYRGCRDNLDGILRSDRFRQIITVFVVQ
ncbi:MAG TPA: hypothetical protein VNO50_14805 [Pyrinomonadaceae bacterium]|nr:hypothetical protein [Pyrinomonadaceae bacterium]